VVRKQLHKRSRRWSGNTIEVDYGKGSLLDGLGGLGVALLDEKGVDGGVDSWAGSTLKK
jgi:hypothetical protein